MCMCAYKNRIYGEVFKSNLLVKLHCIMLKKPLFTLFIRVSSIYSQHELLIKGNTSDLSQQLVLLTRYSVILRSIVNQWHKKENVDIYKLDPFLP